MDFNMAFFAQRKNVKPMLFRVPAMVMVVFCQLPAIPAVIDRRAGKFSDPNGVADNGVCLCAVWIFIVISFVRNTVNYLSFFGLAVFFLGILITVAFFTIRLMSAFFGFVLIKIRQWLDCLAMRTIFCYNPFSHYFSFQKSWLKPLASNELATGLFYCSTNRLEYQA
jgi:hypothetical protein